MAFARRSARRLPLPGSLFRCLPFFGSLAHLRRGLGLQAIIQLDVEGIILAPDPAEPQLFALLGRRLEEPRLLVIARVAHAAGPLLRGLIDTGIEIVSIVSNGLPDHFGHVDPRHERVAGLGRRYFARNDRLLSDLRQAEQANRIRDFALADLVPFGERLLRDLERVEQMLKLAGAFPGGAGERGLPESRSVSYRAARVVSSAVVRAPVKRLRETGRNPVMASCPRSHFLRSIPPP